MNARLALRVLAGLEPVLCLAVNDARTCAQFLHINRLAGNGLRAARSLAEDDSLDSQIRREATALLEGLRLIQKHSCLMAEMDPEQFHKEMNNVRMNHRL